MRKKRRFNEGDWFIVPLRREAHALGLVARADKRGDSFLGYYFTPARSVADEAARIDQLGPGDAVLICATGAAGFVRDNWKVIFSSSPLNREQWPIPIFVSTDMTGRKELETYGDDDVLVPIKAPIGLVQPAIPQHAVEGALFNPGAVEDRLWDRLRDRILTARAIKSE